MSEKKVTKQKKGKEVQNGVIVVPPPKNIGNKEHFQRLNYLYQLGMFNTIQGTASINDFLSKQYIRNLDSISKKTKSNLLPNMKRSICKNCKTILVPTKTCTYEIQNKSNSKSETILKNDTFIIRCKCGETKKFKVGQNKNYKTYYEKSGNLLDIA